MKTHNIKSLRSPHKTLGELVETVSQLTRNERLVAMVVADMINTRQVRIEGAFHGKRVVVTQYSHFPLPCPPHKPFAVPTAKGLLAPGRVIVRIDRRYFRPAEVDTLLGDATKARTMLGWTPEVSFSELVAEMVREDLRAEERDALVQRHGHTVHKRNDG